MPAEVARAEFRKLDRETPGDVEKALQVADIRNAGRQWYTGDTREISQFEQLRWFLENGERSLYAYMEDDEVVGFALLTDRAGQTWIGLGVHPDHQGRGIGTKIYRRFYGVWAEIRADNVASRRAAENAGYEVVYADDQKVVMKG